MQTEQTRGDLRVEQRLRLKSQISESRQIHQGIMQNPSGIAHGIIEFVPVGTRLGQGDGVEQCDARTFSFALNQPILVAITESRCAFGIGGQGARSISQRFADVMIAFNRRGNIRHSPARLFQ